MQNGNHPFGALLVDTATNTVLMTAENTVNTDKDCTGHAETNFLNCTSGWKSWAFTLDHKRIGVMYLVVILASFFLGGVFALALRSELKSEIEAALRQELEPLIRQELQDATQAGETKTPQITFVGATSTRTGNRPHRRTYQG